MLTDEKQLVTEDESEMLSAGSRHALNEYVREHARLGMMEKAMRAERDMFLECIRGTWPDAENVLRTGIMQHWEPERIEAFARSLLGIAFDCQPETAKSLKNKLETAWSTVQLQHDELVRLRDELECERALRLEYEQRVAVAEETLRQSANQAASGLAGGIETPKAEVDSPESLCVPETGEKDEIERSLDALAEMGRETWADVPDAAEWVAELRGHFPGPTFDANGYPTDATLHAIEAWPEAPGVFAFIEAAWKKDYGRTETSGGGRTCIFVTGGWSGNEDLLEALRRNEAIWKATFRERDGGRYEFRIPEAMP